LGNIVRRRRGKLIFILLSRLRLKLEANQGTRTMTKLESAAADFLDARRHEAQTAQQLAALQLACGIDLSSALGAAGPARARILGTVRRALRRERMKGVCGRADYSIERHAALKASLDRLADRKATAPENANGARRRRSR
jgi:hypothetical protein